MQSALRPYVTAGVALVGASAIAVTPVTAPPTAIEEVRDSAVELSALTNPIDAFGPILESAFENAQAAALRIVQNPAPILQQIAVNQINGIGNIGGALEAQVGAIGDLPENIAKQLGDLPATIQVLAGLSQTFLQNLVTVLTSTEPGNVPSGIQDALDLIRQGQYGIAFGNLAVLPLFPLIGPGLANLELIPPLVGVFQQQLANAAELFPIAEGPLTSAQAALGVFANPINLLPVGLGALLAINNLGIATGDTVGGLIDAAQNGDPEAAFKTIVDGAAAATTALLTGALDPNFGLVQGLQTLRETIAAAITPPTSLASVSKAPSGAAQSFTLTAPVEKALPAPKASTPSVDEKSGAVDAGAPASGTDTKDTSGQATPTNTKDGLKGGNLFTPGATSTKGGRHRADTGSFAQGLRDTIKGLTGLDRDKKSDKETSGASASTSGESGSSSSGSGDSGSGGGSGSK